MGLESVGFLQKLIRFSYSESCPFFILLRLYPRFLAQYNYRNLWPLEISYDQGSKNTKPDKVKQCRLCGTVMAGAIPAGNRYG